ncbi:MAG: DUF2179 domain-containing protein [Bacteroidales bacterium]
MINEIFADLVDNDIFLFIIIPLLIFLARIVDQSIGILRILFATKGFKYLALLAGFFESIVWLLAISQIMKHLDNVYCYIAFAGGFAIGNFTGIYIEQRLSIGNVIVRVVFQKDSKLTILLLKRLKFRITIVDAMGMDSPVKMIFATIRRNDLKRFISILNKNNPNAFYTVEDVRMVKEGYFEKTNWLFLNNK